MTGPAAFAALLALVGGSLGSSVSAAGPGTVSGALPDITVSIISVGGVTKTVPEHITVALGQAIVFTNATPGFHIITRTDHQAGLPGHFSVACLGTPTCFVVGPGSDGTQRPSLRFGENDEVLGLTLSIRDAFPGPLGTPLGTITVTAPPYPLSVSTFTWTGNMHPLDDAPSPVPFSGPGASVFNSDIAFWGHRAYQGTYNGFNVIDIADPSNMVKLLDWNLCNPDTASGPTSSGNQGDILVWGGTHPSDKKADLLIRAHNSNATGVVCGALALPDSFEGLTFIDIRDELNPRVFAAVDLPNGTHTLTLIPDAANGRVYVSSNSSGGENGVRIVEVPLDAADNPAAQGINPAALVNHGLKSNNPADYGTLVPAVDPVTGLQNIGRSCHDTGVILGSVRKMGCSGGNGYALWNLDPGDPVYGTHPVNGLPAGITNPVLMRSPNISATTGHTASFTWDGEIFIFGSEPGGGSGASCMATGANAASTDRNKSIRFFDAKTGIELGRHVLPRPQQAQENCTIHNLNVVPLPDKKGKNRYVLVHGSYQSGIGVVDFSDIRNPAGLVTDPNLVSGGAQHANLTTEEIAYADPAPLTPSLPIVLGGDWSSHWYDGNIFESDIRRGVMSWKLSDSAVAGALKLGHLNPQTQEFSFE